MSTRTAIYPPRVSTMQPKKVVNTLLGLLLTALFLFPFYMILESSLMAQTDVLRYPPPLVSAATYISGYTTALTTSGGFILASLNYGIGHGCRDHADRYPSSLLAGAAPIQDWPLCARRSDLGPNGSRLCGGELALCDIQPTTPDQYAYCRYPG